MSQEIKQEVTQTIANYALGTSVVSGAAVDMGWFDFINANAPGLGFIASVVFGLIATMFYFITYIKKTANTKEIEKLRIQNINNALEVKRLNDKISNISDRKSD